MDDTLNSTKQHDDLEHSQAKTQSGAEAAGALIADIFAHLETPDPALASSNKAEEVQNASEDKNADVPVSSSSNEKLARFAARKAPTSSSEPKVERDTPENDAAYDLKSLLEKLPSSAANGRVHRKSSEDVSNATNVSGKASDANAPSEAQNPQEASAADESMKSVAPQTPSDDETSASAQEKKSYAPTRKTVVSDAPASPAPDTTKDDDKKADNDPDHEDEDDDMSDEEADDESLYEEDDLRPATSMPATEPIYDGRMLSQALVSSGRAFSHAVMHVGGTRKRAGRFWMIVIGMLILMALLVVLAHYKHREIKLGYELSNAISEREALLEENRKLRIELRVHSSRDRLEPMASRQLGLTQLRPEQILFIRQEEQPATPPEAAPSQRSDGLDRVKLLEDK